MISPFRDRAPGEGTPFDDSTESASWKVHALAGPHWLNAASDDDLRLIASIADFDFVHLLTVAGSPASERRASAVGLNVGSLEVAHEIVALRASHSSELAGHVTMLDRLRTKTTNDDTALEQLLGLSGLSYDYLIGLDPPPWTPHPERGPAFVRLNEFIEHLRKMNG